MELNKNDRWQLNLDTTLGYGMFHSSESYAGTPSKEAGSSSWNEGYYKAGFSGSYSFSRAGQIYGAWNYLGSAVWRDGDAAGYAVGSERKNAVEDAYLGWKSADLLPLFGKDGVDVSAGRQEYTIGSGFLIEGDALNFGKGFDGVAPQSLNRGGAYWMAPRLAFDKTAIVKVGQKAWRGELFWFESDNKAQAETEMMGANLMWVDDTYGTVGFTWLHGLDVDDELAEFLGYEERDGQDTYSLRYDGSLGVDGLSLGAEYVSQDNGANGDDRAWYLETGWTFSDIAWKPAAGVRYSTFSDGYDTLFYGFSTGYGTWFQGEVAGNYAGPFNTDADIWHGFLSAQPFKTLSVGVLYFDFDTRSSGVANLNGHEIDIYAEWQITDSISFSPVLGFYTPDNSAAEGGSQLGNDDTNTYMQATLLLSF